MSHLQFCHGLGPFLLDRLLVLFDALWHTRHNVPSLTAASGLYFFSECSPSRGKQTSGVFLHSDPHRISSHCLGFEYGHFVDGKHGQAGK